jgi:hypothetical protein
MKTALSKFKMLMIALSAMLLAGTTLAQSTVEEVDWTRPGTDFSKYNKFMVKPLRIDNTRVLKPAWEQDNDEEWSFEAGTGEEIQDMFMTVFTHALTRGDGFEIVNEAGDDVLQVEVEFLSLTPYTRPGSQYEENAGYEISTLGSGDVVVSAEFRDSVTGSLLVLVEGERQIGTEYRELTTENHVANLEATFNKWGNVVRAWMEVQRAKANQ